MREEYEQLELDTRRQLDKAIAQLTEDTVKTAGEMITACGEAPTAVRNRHEAFGIAAERLAKIKKAVKAIDGDTSILLGTLPDANYPAIEAVSSICNSTLEAAATMIEAAAEMRRTLRDLYEAENTARSEEVTPMEEWASAAQFQDADPTDNTETEDE
ncbi:hypothetical protein LI148_03385 [Colidextribacter sp. 210702-DFI.3.9]|jgi:hypothetical protein|nr:hypothetical protein [Colidextribacter sp. 210702-DFI.3.9]